MVRPLLLFTALAGLALAPVAAQAAPARVAAPVSAQSDGLAGTSTPGLVLGAAVFALIIILLITDDDDNVDIPTSP